MSKVQKQAMPMFSLSNNMWPADHLRCISCKDSCIKINRTINIYAIQFFKRNIKCDNMNHQLPLKYTSKIFLLKNMSKNSNLDEVFVEKYFVCPENFF